MKPCVSWDVFPPAFGPSYGFFIVMGHAGHEISSTWADEKKSSERSTIHTVDFEILILGLSLVEGRLTLLVGG